MPVCLDTAGLRRLVSEFLTIDEVAQAANVVHLLARHSRLHAELMKEVIENVVRQGHRHWQALRG